MQVISKARKDVARAKMEALEICSKNIKFDLSHVISISLSVDFFGRTYQCREIVILLDTPNPKFKTVEDRHDKADNIHTI